MLVSLNVFASDWQKLTTSDGTILDTKMDLQNITQGEKNFYKIWTKVEYQKIIADKELSISYNKILTRYEVDCNTDSMAWLSSNYYLNGALVTSGELPSTEKKNYSDIVPDSVGEAVVRLMCKNNR